MLSAFKNFGITFLISAVLFGFIAYFATGFVTNEMNDLIAEEKTHLDEIIQNPDISETSDTESVDPIETDPVGSDSELIIPEGDSFNFLVISTDYRPDLYTTYMPTSSIMSETDWNSVASSETLGCLSSDYRDINVTSIVLVRVDKEDRQFTYTYITPYTRVYTTSGYQTLSSVYNFFGKQTVADYVHSLTGIEIKYTFLINAYNLDELTNLIQGVTVYAPKDVYSDGKYNTLNFETIVEKKTDGDSKQTEHIPNTFIISAGEKKLDFSNIYHLTTVIEHSDSDLKVKETYMTQMIQRYLEYLASLEEDRLKILIAQLITKSSDWSNIEGLISDQQMNSPDSDQSNENQQVVGEKTWIGTTFEPDTPIIETDNYSMNDFDSIVELIGAVKYFDNVLVSYPFEYHAADENNDEYFAANIQEGLEQFMQYRAEVKPHNSAGTEN